MTNPNNAVGTNAAYSGRTSVNAFNDGISAYSRGIMSGWACLPNTGLKVSLGGSGNVRDVAIAEDNSGNKTTINNISGSPIDVTLASAPASNSRIDSIVVYVDNPPTGLSSTADNPAACGIIAVKGIVASSPTAPTDNEIRSAITADGASGVTAYYAVLANITIPSGTTTLTSSNISAGNSATIGNNQLGSNIVEYQNIDFTTFTGVSTTVNLGYNISAEARRIGNLVIVEAGTQVKNISNINTRVLISGVTMPSGYRPVTSGNIFSATQDFASVDSKASWEISHDGSIFISNANPGQTRFALAGVWFTTDAMP